MTLTIVCSRSETDSNIVAGMDLCVRTLSRSQAISKAILKFRMLGSRNSKSLSGSFGCNKDYLHKRRFSKSLHLLQQRRFFADQTLQTGTPNFGAEVLSRNSPAVADFFGNSSRESNPMDLIQDRNLDRIHSLDRKVCMPSILSWSLNISRALFAY